MHSLATTVACPSAILNYSQRSPHWIQACIGPSLRIATLDPFDRRLLHQHCAVHRRPWSLRPPSSSPTPSSSGGSSMWCLTVVKYDQWTCNFSRAASGRRPHVYDRPRSKKCTNLCYFNNRVSLILFCSWTVADLWTSSAYISTVHGRNTAVAHGRDARRRCPHVCDGPWTENKQTNTVIKVMKISAFFLRGWSLNKGI